MSRTVTALYDNRAEAEAARQRLSSHVSVSSAKVIDKESHGSGNQDGSLNRVAMSHEDRHAYGEGIRRGGFLLCAEVTSHEDTDEIVRLLEESSSVDLDQRQNEWARDGWAPHNGGTGSAGMTGTGSAGMTGTGSSGLTGGGASSGFMAGAGTSGATRDTSGTVAEEHIPIVEEQLVVGKREVERGGARVRTYVREVPVHEQVTLREEHVDVERRPVQGERLSQNEAAGMMQDRTVELTATAEEAVVAKEARIAEEVVVRKTAEEHVEQIDDTVRRTEVEVDEGRTGGERSAFGGLDNDRDNSTSR